MMNRKQIVLPLLASLCFVLPMTASAQGKRSDKPVKFTLSNKSAAPIELKAGDQPVTLAAGEAKTMQAPAGTKIVTAADSSRGSAGTVVTQISGDMNGSTVDLH